MCLFCIMFQVSGGSFRDGVHNGYPPGLFFLQGEQWQQIRHIVSPTFSSKKLKKVCYYLNDL